MKKKNKTDHRDTEAVNYMAGYLKSRVGDDVETAYETQEDIEYKTCTIKRDGYCVKLKLAVLIESVEMDYVILYPDSDIEFSLTDVFNVLDINDFNDYFFDVDIEDENSERKAIDDFTELINRYDYDIKKAGDSYHLSRMCDMHNEDKAIYDSNNVKIRSLIKSAALEHKMRKTKTDKAKNAYIKFMKKQQATVGIDHNTRRYIEYLEMGYPIPDNYQDEDSEDETKSGIAMLKSYAVCCAVGIFISFVIFGIDRLFIMQKGIVTNGMFEYTALVVSGLFLGYCVSRIFVSKLMCRLLPAMDKEKVVGFYKKRYDDDPIVRKIFLKYLGPFFAAFAFMAFLYGACNTVCIAEDSIIEHNIFDNTQIRYEDARVYLVKGFLYEDEYELYEYPYYTFEQSDKSISTGELKNEKQRCMVENALKKYNITPSVVDKYEE